MRLSLVDKTTDPALRPQGWVLDAIAAAGERWIRKATRAWGEYLVHIAEELDGFPIELHDTLDIDGALGYHDNDPTLGPYAKVGVGAILNAGGTWCGGALSVSAVVLHEALEIIGDPIANRWADENPSTSWAQELCDAVQDDVTKLWVQPNQQAQLIPVSVPDFVLPDYFNPYGDGPYDALHLLSAPFEIRGYGIRRQGDAVDAVFPDGALAFWVKARTHRRSRYAERGGKPIPAS